MSSKVWVARKSQEEGLTSVRLTFSLPDGGAGSVWDLEDFISEDLGSLQEEGVDVIWLDGDPCGLTASGARMALEKTGDLSWGVIHPKDLEDEVSRRLRRGLYLRHGIPRDTPDRFRITWPVGHGLITVHGSSIQDSLDEGVDFLVHARGSDHFERDGSWVGSVGIYLPLSVESSWGDAAVPLLVDSPCGCLRVFLVGSDLVGRVVRRCEDTGRMWVKAQVRWSGVLELVSWQ